MSLPEMLHIGSSIHEAETPVPGRVAIDWSVSGQSVDCIRTGATLSVERRQRLQGLRLHDCACLTLKPPSSHRIANVLNWLSVSIQEHPIFSWQISTRHNYACGWLPQNWSVGYPGTN